MNRENKRHMKTFSLCPVNISYLSRCVCVIMCVSKGVEPLQFWQPLARPPLLEHLSQHLHSFLCHMLQASSSFIHEGSGVKKKKKQRETTKTVNKK